MKKVVIFGSGKIAEVLAYYFMHESNYQLSAFTCDDKFVVSTTFQGLPLVPFSRVQELYPPDDYSLFVAVGYQDLNELRQQKYVEGKNMGYEIVSYVNPNSGIPQDTVLGENCFVMNNVCIHPKVAIGNNTFVWSGSMIGHHSVIGDNCWLTSSTNISGVVQVGNNCFFGVNSTIGHGVKIGHHCFLGANCLVTKDMLDNQVVVAENTKIFRLDSKSFLKLSKFSNL